MSEGEYLTQHSAFRALKTSSGPPSFWRAARVVAGLVVLVWSCVVYSQAPVDGRQGGAAQPAPARVPAPPQPLPVDAPFTVAVNTATLEAAPVYIAVARGGQANYRFINGGVRSLLNGGAHAATNAETQMLLAIDANPKIRMLFTLADGLYRIVAKRSAGIRTLADLNGKRVVLPRNTSAHYSLVRLLATAGVQEADVTIVTASNTEMALTMVKGEADAISMWEPESQNAVDALGTDAIVFSAKGVYREGFSFYSTTDVLSDPRRRKELVGFSRRRAPAAAPDNTAGLTPSTSSAIPARRTWCPSGPSGGESSRRREIRASADSTAP
jgi:ABC-type nitrate/sulfonate/bicarbonate transport system substrate-binding protein